MKKTFFYLLTVYSLLSCETKRVNSNEGYLKGDVFYFQDVPFDGIVYITNPENGILEKEGTMKNGLPDGPTTEYFKSGRIKSTYNYKNGKRNGPYNHFKSYENGEYYLKEKANYFNGNWEGEYFQYNRDGEIIESGYYKNGNKDSLWKTFEKTSSGDYILTSTGFYSEDQRSGIWAEYKTSSNLTMFSEYEKGSIVSQYVNGSYVYSQFSLIGNTVKVVKQKTINEFIIEENELTIEEGKKFLAENSKKENIVTLESGLQYEVIKHGEGVKPTINDQVIAHYHGTLIDGTVFDSSIDRGEPASFPVNGVIAGWTEALQIMPVGSKWKLYVPSELAFGEGGVRDQIAPFATLIFEIELISVL